MTIALKQVSEAPVPPSELNPRVTPELEAVVLRALAKEPRDRFADADEFIASLEAAASRIPSPRAIAAAEAAAAALPAAAAVGAAAGIVPPPSPPAPPRGPSGPPTGVQPVASSPPARTAPPARPAVARPPRPPAARKRWPWIAARRARAARAHRCCSCSVLAPNRVTVPNVVGGSVSTATNRLQSEGFEVEAVRDNSDKPRNTVIGQNPGGGTVADEGSLVRITVSEGPALADVPDVVGKGRLVARRTLTAAGFEVNETRSASATVAVNRVIAQNPDGDSFSETGATVTIEVSIRPGARDRARTSSASRSRTARSALDDFKVAIVEQGGRRGRPGHRDRAGSRRAGSSRAGPPCA